MAEIGQWKSGMFDDQVVRGQFKIVIGTKAEIVVLLLRRCVNPSSLIAAEWPLLVVARHNVLTEFRPDQFEQVAEVTNDWKVADNGLFALRDVLDDKQHDQHQYCQPKPHRE